MTDAVTVTLTVTPEQAERCLEKIAAIEAGGVGSISTLSSADFRTLLALGRAALAFHWRPIETAPTASDCEVLVAECHSKLAPEERRVVLRKADGEWWRSQRAEGRLMHLWGWMPAPQLPSACLTIPSDVGE